MIRRRILRLLCGLALGLMLFDIGADAGGCHDSGKAVTVCHACSCSSHIISPAIQGAVMAPIVAPFAVHVPVPYAVCLTHSFFHPPRVAA